MLETFDQFPHHFVQGGRNSDFLTPFHDGAIHEINFSLTLGQDVLQHAGAVFAGSIGALLHQLSRIAMERDSQFAVPRPHLRRSSH